MMLCVPLLSGQFHMAPLDMLLSVLKVGGILGAVLLAAHLGLNRFMEAVMRTARASCSSSRPWAPVSAWRC